MVSKCVPERTMPANIGTSKAPAGILLRAPNSAPPTAKASVPPSANGSTGANHATDAVGAVVCKPHRRATTDAVSATSTTRKNCMKATSRASAP